MAFIIVQNLRAKFKSYNEKQKNLTNCIGEKMHSLELFGSVIWAKKKFWTKLDKMDFSGNKINFSIYVVFEDVIMKFWIYI